MIEKQKIVLIDYCQGNLRSIYRKIINAGLYAVVSNEQSVISNADKIIFPGVGHFGRAMQYLREYNLIETLFKHVIIRKKPILGICLGMQLFSRESEEGDALGLGWIEAEVKKLNFSDQTFLKVPHMGWNSLNIKRESEFLRGITPVNSFYFAHSYYLKFSNNEDTLADTTYGIDFPSVICFNNIYGTQFHPEKSHKAGEQILNNYFSL
jgi:glutamine amidotransferase